MIKSASRSSITNDQKYRSMLAGTVPSSEYLIETRILASNTAAITFDNLAQYAGIYKHLKIVSTERHTDAVAESYGVITINGTNGAETHFLYGSGSIVGSIRDEVLMAYSLGAGAVTNNYGVKVMDILDAFSTSKNKTLRSLFGCVDPSIYRIVMQSGLWANTAAINSITITSISSYATGSRFSLYGVTA